MPTPASLRPPDPYNDRLFHGNAMRSFLHRRRFHWMAARLARYGVTEATVVEVGCHDAKTIRFLESAGIAVRRFVGFEANLEVLEAARETWRERPEVELHHATSAAEMHLPDGSFNTGVCMETLEHLSDDLADDYLAALARAVAGYMFVTVPVERGAMLLAKQFAYRAFNMYGERLSAAELLNGILGRTDRIPRHEHKGFDDRAMVRRVARHFEVIEAGGLFVPGLPTLNFTLGIVGKSKPVV